MKYIITKQLQGGMASNPFLAVLSIYDAGILLLTKKIEYETKPTDTKILNDFKAMKDNSCRMPVKSDIKFSEEEYFSFQNNSQVNNWFLSDVIYLGNRIISVGDIFLYFGGGISVILGIYSLVILISNYLGEKSFESNQSKISPY